MTKDELEDIRADSETSCDCGYQDIRALLAELDRHMCKCGHWMREHGFDYTCPDVAGYFVSQSDV